MIVITKSQRTQPKTLHCKESGTPVLLGAFAAIENNMSLLLSRTCQQEVQIQRFSTAQVKSVINYATTLVISHVKKKKSITSNYRQEWKNRNRTSFFPNTKSLERVVMHGVREPYMRTPARSLFSSLYLSLKMW